MRPDVPAPAAPARSHRRATSIAALLGRWFWWPIKVRPRPASTMLRPTGPRPLVRSLLGESNGLGEDAKTVLGNGEAKTAPLPKARSE
jgi:hypothetical protein